MTNKQKTLQEKWTERKKDRLDPLPIWLEEYGDNVCDLLNEMDKMIKDKSNNIKEQKEHD